MITDKNTLIKIIEFYLTNENLISRELQYKKQSKNTNSCICVHKLLSPIPFDEADCIYSCISSVKKNFSSEKLEYLRMRYRNKCTFDVICGFLDTRRSSLFKMGRDILEEILYNILLNDDAKKYITHTDVNCYFLQPHV